MIRNNTNWGAEAPSKNEVDADRLRTISDRGGTCNRTGCDVSDPEDLILAGPRPTVLCTDHYVESQRKAREAREELEERMEAYHRHLEAGR